MKLTEAQRKILVTAILQADTPESEIARSLGIKEHVVRRTMMLFFEHGIFRRRSIFVDPHTLGLLHHVVHITLPLKSRKHQVQFIETLSAMDEVGAVVELGGDSHIEIRTYTRSPEHLRRLFEEVADRFKHPFYIHGHLNVEEQEYSGVSMPGLSVNSRPPLRYLPLAPSKKPAALEERDHQILYALANEQYSNLGQLARHLSLPASSLTYRVQNLEKLGIIVGHYYIVDVKALNEIPVCFKVQSRVLRPKEKQALRTFCQKHPRIAWITFFFGAQSAEIFCRVQNYSEANAILSEISGYFEGIIDSVTLTPQIQFYKYSTYPFRQFPG
jgi:DNA-binding Lrp family transcriptional regulator